MESIAEKRRLLDAMWNANSEVGGIFRDAAGLEDVRDKFFAYVHRQERRAGENDRDENAWRAGRVRAALAVLKDVVSERNERLAGVACLKYLHRLACDPTEFALNDVSNGFLEEFRHLFSAVSGNPIIPDPKASDLSGVGAQVNSRLAEYASGLEDDVCSMRGIARSRVMDYFGVGKKHWSDWRWHQKNLIRDSKTFASLVPLSDDERIAIDRAVENNIPFAITPYHASLLSHSGDGEFDYSLRRQVIPTMYYVDSMIGHRGEGRKALDFMQEQNTNPVELVVRRYPSTAVIKPFNACAQVCTYCQRNWELCDWDESKANVPREKFQNAVSWLKGQKEISEVLVTGGDAFMMEDGDIEFILDELSRIDHVERIRFCTRTLVVLPQRITKRLAKILAAHQEPGRREVCVVTHFQHPSEVTLEAQAAVRLLKGCEINIYNQSVFTVQNARRFELAALKRCLKLIGVDPYYTFVTKGKSELKDVRVPIARIMQERCEESRMLSGLIRTDEVVFNVPLRGKNSLMSERHRVIMIAPSGARIVEFEPWNSMSSDVRNYIYEDVPIWEYLEAMRGRGEDISEYQTVWYYY